MKKRIWIKNIYAVVVGIFITCCFSISSSLASEKHEKGHEHEKGHGHEKRQLESHEHGVSTLKIAFENQSLDMELESPANDIVGFEHAPENKSQKTAIEKALSLLKSKPGIFRAPPTANCKINNVSGEFKAEKDHAGFHVIWKIKCLNPEELKYLETTFFQNFSKAQEIEVEIISASGQRAIEWGNKTKKIKLPNLSK